jgi:hypothetical protein
MTSTSKSYYRPNLETLEDRLVPSANGLSATLNAGVLTITDAAPNSSVVLREISGVFKVDQLAGAYAASKVSEIHVELPFGYDRVQITNATTSGQQNITKSIWIDGGVGMTGGSSHNVYQGLRSQDMVRDPRLTGSMWMNYATAVHWQASGADKSPLGMPTVAQAPAGDKVGVITYFEDGAIYWSAAGGAHETHGDIYAHWLDLGGMKSPFRAPIGDERTSADGQGRISYFQGGAIDENGVTGFHTVQGPSYSLWKSLGGDRGQLGDPLTNELVGNNGRISYFRGGTISYAFGHSPQASYNSGKPWARLDAVASSLGDQDLAQQLRNLVLDDGELSRDDLMGLLFREEDLGGLNAEDVKDFRTLAANNQAFHMPYDVANLLTKLNQDITNSQDSVNNPQPVSASQLGALVDDWFRGGQLPDSGGDPFAYAEGTLYGPSGKPQINDIAQGWAADCYFLASAAETLSRNASRLQNQIIDNGDGTFTIGFNKAASGKTPSWDYVTVNRWFPAYYRDDNSDPFFVNANSDQDMTDSNNVLWVPLYEKAYVQVAAEGWSRAPDAGDVYSSIDYGWPSNAMRQIAGVNAKDESIDAANVYQQLTQGVPTGSWAVLSSNKDESDADVVANHCYAVLGYDAKSKLFTIFNPYGSVQQITWSAIRNDFDSVSVTF